MSHKIVLSLWFSVLLLGADSEEQVNGILGDSATFQVKTSQSFKSISWTKAVSSNSEIIVVVIFGEPCSLLVPDPAYQKRVNVSKDCRELHLSHLEKEDAGRFTAGIIPPDAKRVDEYFDLKIFRHLLDSEMKVTCTGVGNGTWKLNCSTETLEDGVKFSWFSDVQSKNPLLRNSAIFISHDLNLTVTCAAENLVSYASTTVSFKKVCAEKKPRMEAPHVNDEEHTASSVKIVVVIVAVSAVLLFPVICLWVKKAAKWRQRFTTCSGDVTGS